MKAFATFSSLLVLGTVGFFFSSFVSADNLKSGSLEEDVYLYL